MNFLTPLICTTLLVICCTQNVNAQKILQIEKVGSHKLVRFYPGNEVTFKLKNAPGWFTRRINDIDAEQDLILFEKEGFVNINDISHIQKTAAKAKWRGMANSLYVFGLNWGFWSLGGTLLGDELTWLAAIVPATACVLGSTIKWLAKGKVWKMGKRRRLRVLDLGFSLAVA